MSLGLHRTIRSSFVEASRKRSDKIVKAISTELSPTGA
jgi:hypothetical protein